MNGGAPARTAWPVSLRGAAEMRAPLALAVSIGLHGALIALVAFLSVVQVVPPQPLRVVLIDAPAGGGGSKGPHIAPGPPGEPVGPPLPPIPDDLPPPPPAVAGRERIAARPRRKPPDQRRRPATRAPESATMQAQPTPGSAVPEVAALGASEGAAGGNGTGGGGGGGGGEGSGVGRGRGSGTGDGVDSVVARYLSGVRKRLEAVKRYPILARRRGTEGTATLAIEIGRDGRPAAVLVSTSSGSALLDSEAEQMVERAAPFDPLPTELDDLTLRVVVPVSFDIGS